MMKISLLYLFVLSMPFLGLGSTLPRIQIHGQLIGFNTPDKSIPKKVRYTLPLNGSCYWGFSDTATVNRDGSFDIVLESGNSIFIKMYILDSENGIVIFANPSDTIEVFLYKTDDQEHFKINPNQEAHQLFNSLFSKLSPSIHKGLFDYTKKQSVLDDKLIAIEKAQNSFEYQIDSLDKINTIDPLLKRGFFRDLDIYFTTLKSKAILYDMVNQKKSSLYLSLGERLFNKELLNSKEFIRSNWWFDYAQNFIKFNLLQRVNFNLDSIQNSHSDYIEEAQNILSNRALEHFTARYIHHFARQKKFNQELIPIYKEFMAMFPNSEFFPFINPPIEAIIAFHHIRTRDSESDITFVANYDQIETFDKLKLIFKGRAVYINLWTTWCLPCKNEFQFINKLKSKADAKNIQLVFISLDKPEKKAYWQKMITHYKLAGEHILANQALYESIVELYKGPVTLPKYIFVDGDNEILSLDYSAPSEIIKSGFKYQ